MATDIQRYIDMDGVCNLRELGGYVNTEGKAIGGHRLWRSDALHQLSAAGIVQLRAAGLVAVIDLRDAAELERAPNPFARDEDIEYHHVPLLAKLDLSTHSAGISDEDKDPLLSMYCDIVTTRQAALHTAMSVLAEARSGLVLVHCAVGKDRTGVFVALVLAMLDLPLETIVKDYALSEARIAPFQERIIMQLTDSEEEARRILPLLVSVPATMKNMFGYIRRRYGSLDNYLKQLDPQGKLRPQLQSRLFV